MDSTTLTPLRKRVASDPSESPSPVKHRRYIISTPLDACMIDTPLGSSEFHTMIVQNSRSPPLCLDDLPDEILLLICQNLSEDLKGPGYRKNTLASLCRTNKHLNRIATELMYACVDYRLPGNAGMVQTLTKSPRLAELVKKIKFRLHDDGFVFNTPIMDRQYSRVLQLATNLQHLLISDHCNVRQDHDPVTSQPQWLNMFNQAARGIPNPCVSRFTNLQSLNLAVDCGFMAADVSFVFRLPSLRALSLRLLLGPDKIDDWSVPEASSNIRYLQLSSCFLDSAVVAQLLSSIKALESFDYEYTTSNWQPLGQGNNPHTHWAESVWDEIGDGLRKHQDSLVLLKLQAHMDSDILKMVYPDGRDIRTLGSLKEFHQLKVLACQLEALIHVQHETDLAQKLPDGLEKLLLEIEPSEEDCHLHRRALISLKDGIFTKPKKEFNASLYTNISVGRFHFSDTFDILTQAGIGINILVETDEELKVLTLEDLREMEDEEDNDGCMTKIIWRSSKRRTIAK
ncbi:hypothetical protein P153DRAFT_393493 [Dothidotthia symphoricarpi CBS 119687]|uniref:Leucine-rich repeat domain-containing protein n=1 Tax=Dothidotthia symphoricarpi CBS 119687 TaxID=1392245 RepID=A0A6A6ALT5_9PLEO|nr:uncharacterized protein P153DRAFT_393493 [Dothidotthia symphoricarpi CBS 119687]KAF2132516.1 hypothetical protein P153DRAFT_393493 [Dothidotthia symphoricarpi CBS 119687]